MKSDEIYHFIDHLGRRHADLIADGLIPDGPLLELFPDSETVYFEPERGVSMTFSPESKVFEKLFLTLKKTTSSTVEYEGELPDGLTLTMSQDQVHEDFGDPAENQGPVKLPLPVGWTGGWDIYPYNSMRFLGVDLVFKYNSERQVTSLVFKRQSKSETS